MGTNEFLDVVPEMVTYVRVAQSGSFSAAARQLHLSPSGVSKQIAKLERALGVLLLIRTTRKVRLTDVGMEVYQKCNELVEAAQATMQVAERFMSRPQGMVRMSAPKAFAKHVLHPPVLDFPEAYPDVDVHMIVNARAVDTVLEPPADRTDAGDAWSDAMRWVPPTLVVRARKLGT